MSSSLQAVWDDEREWSALSKQWDCDSRWKLYSSEYYLAKELHSRHGYTGRELRLAVAHAKQKKELETQQHIEWQELQNLITLEKKYQ